MKKETIKMIVIIAITAVIAFFAGTKFGGPGRRGMPPTGQGQQQMPSTEDHAPVENQ